MPPELPGPIPPDILIKLLTELYGSSPWSSLGQLQQISLFNTHCKLMGDDPGGPGLLGVKLQRRSEL